ncbi:MAG: glutamate synthase large subunit [Deltaproteobacteria bacterium]|nr:glutamate synthase large subunit [Deltaproteobacteria bacterium]
MKHFGLPPKEGLYDPRLEHDACGIGFVANLYKPSHKIVSDGIHILECLTHRGAAGADPESGDGAGILLQSPHGFLAKVADEAGFGVPNAGEYASGLVFFSQDAGEAQWQRSVVEQAVGAEHQSLLGWREVPIDPDKIGVTARSTLPGISQVFIGRAEGLDQDAFERKLYVIRRIIENTIAKRDQCFTIASLSSRTFLYKGLMMAHQVAGFFPDLADQSMESQVALVHQRYATNTFPTWDLAQPFRYVAHNGEINTLRGNVNWMRARQGTVASELFGDDLEKLFPIIVEGASDSAQFDNCLEFLTLSGRDISHALLMMIPEAWENQPEMSADRRAFYEYYSCMMEPWDGPASMVFSDGRGVGGVLDRNGLRPSRFVLGKDGTVVMGSEVGTLPIAPENVERKGRLEPGRTFYIDLEEGRIIEDEELKDSYIRKHPYRTWVETQRLTMEDLPAAAVEPPPNLEARLRLQQAFGYTLEEIRLLISAMINTGQEATGSMGDDTALAVLSDRPRPLFHYFKQLFAQVTNPAIDSILERPVMSLNTLLGSSQNLLIEDERHARRLRLERPVLTDPELARILAIDAPGFEVATVSMLFKVSEAKVSETAEVGGGMRDAVARMCAEVETAVDGGANIIVISDRGVAPDLAPIPSLLAIGAVHHHLIRVGKRTRCGIILETGEAREVGHFALLVGYGANAINPYLVIETVGDMIADGAFTQQGLSYDEAVGNYIYAVDKGLLKIFAKMGISTLASYQGAQIYEAVGLADDVIELAFSGTYSRISGISLDVVAKEACMRHARAFPGTDFEYPELDAGGLYQWRSRGERHSFNPESVAKLQQAVREEKWESYEAFRDAADSSVDALSSLRGLLQFKWAKEPVPLDEVEPAAEIVKRFRTGAMSYGSISAESHETLAIAMNRLGGKSNTGEGGEDTARFTPDSNGDLRRSSIKQVASGRFGVTSFYLVNSDEMQIKIAQGAKPGEGGQLPGHKVDRTIAATRHSTPGVGLISPPPHHDIYSIEDLAQLIHDLKNANRFGDVSVKLVSESGVGTIAAGVAKGKSDHVLISGHDGGTGASPQTSIKYAGVPWEIGLSETQQTLVKNDLRGRIRVEVDGGFKTGRDVVIGALLGADAYGFATAPLVAIGCILMRVCHLNTCPVGIATQDKELRKRFKGKPEHVERYLIYVAEDARRIMAKLGFRSVDEMVGHADRLEMVPGISHWKAKGVKLDDLLVRPDVPYDIRHTGEQDHGLELALDNQLLELAAPALERAEAVEINLPIKNTNRTVGTILGSDVSLKYGPDGLPEDTIRLNFTGSAGQSLGAWLPSGITIDVVGDANDYVGKGLSGGKIIVRVPESATFNPGSNIIAGNVLLYGATGGEAYFQGVVGERFCVRNSGAETVVEGVGDHGCEYMTGGRAIIIGPTGRNFAAGMSGGVAYVLDQAGDFLSKVNNTAVDFDPLEANDVEIIQRSLRRHFQYTRSSKADEILRKWNKFAPMFVKLVPQDYKRALAELATADDNDG